MLILYKIILGCNQDIKEVDDMEKTLRFYQEIYNSDGVLIEIHQKYPEDRGHRKVRDEGYDDHS